MSSREGRRYLVTGGAGFIGSNFVDFLFRREPTAYVRVLDKLSYSSNLDSLSKFESNPNFEFIKGNICDRDTVRSALQGIQIVVNFAAEVAVDRSIQDADLFLRTGIFGVHSLLEEARLQQGLMKYVQVSTDEVYGQIMEGSFRETSELRPRNLYSAVKLSGEILALSYFETFGVPVVVTRGSNTYGPKAHPEKVIPLFITNLIDGKRVPLFGDGGQVRDWLYVEDHCEAIYTVALTGENGEVYNVAGRQECTNLELTRKILNTMDMDDSMIKFVMDRPCHDFRYSVDSEKLAALGWKRRYTLDEGLARTIEWYRQNEEWWRPLKEKLDKRYEEGFWGECA